jgi:hypothetical protein
MGNTENEKPHGLISIVNGFVTINNTKGKCDYKWLHQAHPDIMNYNVISQASSTCQFIGPGRYIVDMTFEDNSHERYFFDVDIAPLHDKIMEFGFVPNPGIENKPQTPNLGIAKWDMSPLNEEHFDKVVKALDAFDDQTLIDLHNEYKLSGVDTLPGCCAATHCRYNFKLWIDEIRSRA